MERGCRRGRANRKSDGSVWINGLLMFGWQRHLFWRYRTTAWLDSIDRIDEILNPTYLDAGVLTTTVDGSETGRIGDGKDVAYIMMGVDRKSVV